MSLPEAPASGYKVSVLSDVNFDQGVDLTNQGGFYPDVIERALDKLTLQTLQLRERVGRALLASVASGISPDDYLGQALGAADAAVSAAAQAVSAANTAIVAAEQAQAIAGLDISNLALKNGTNATGTWPIGINGNAATATDAQKLGGIAAASYVRKVNGSGPDANGNVGVSVPVSSVFGRTGAVALAGSDVTGALGYTPAAAGAAAPANGGNSATVGGYSGEYLRLASASFPYQPGGEGPVYVDLIFGSGRTVTITVG